MRVFLIMLTFFSSLNGCGFDCYKYLTKNVKPILINGTVSDKKKSETGCFGSIILKSENKIDTINNLCYCVMSNDMELWKYVISGDSLYKAEKSLVVEVHRGGKMRKFAYPCCSQ